MYALRTVAYGLLIVLVDLRLNDSLDLVPDPIGWLVAVAALCSLGRVNALFEPAALVAGIGLAVSIPDWFDTLGGFGALLDEVVSIVLLALVCTAIADSVPPLARRARTIRGWAVALAVVAIPFSHLTGEPSGPLAPIGLAATIGSFGVLVWFLVFLFQVSREPAPEAVPARR